MLVYCIQCRPRLLKSTFIKFNTFTNLIPATNIQVKDYHWVENAWLGQDRFCSMGICREPYQLDLREELSDEIFENKVKTRKLFSRRASVRMIIDLWAWTESYVREGGRVSWGPRVMVGVLLVNRQWDLMGSGHMGTLSPCRQTDRQTDRTRNIKHYLPTNYGNYNSPKETILPV